MYLIECGMKATRPALITLAVIALLIAKPAQADVVLGDWMGPPSYNWMAPPSYNTGASPGSNDAKPSVQVFAPDDGTASAGTISMSSGFQLVNVTFPDGPNILPMPAVPEPSTWAMMILGFVGVGFMTYRRRNQILRAV
jgi:PEP-CTERM motif